MPLRSRCFSYSAGRSLRSHAASKAAWPLKRLEKGVIVKKYGSRVTDWWLVRSNDISRCEAGRPVELDRSSQAAIAVYPQTTKWPMCARALLRQPWLQTGGQGRSAISPRLPCQLRWSDESWGRSNLAWTTIWPSPLTPHSKTCSSHLIPLHLSQLQSKCHDLFE